MKSILNQEAINCSSRLLINTKDTSVKEVPRAISDPKADPKATLKRPWKDSNNNERLDKKTYQNNNYLFFLMNYT